MVEEGGYGHQHCVKSVSPRGVGMRSYSLPPSRARRMAISLRADACLRAATMGDPAGTRSTTDAFPFFPLGPDAEEGAASDAACMLPAILATTVAVSYPFFSLLDAGHGGLVGWVGSVGRSVARRRCSDLSPQEKAPDPRPIAPAPP